MPEGLAVVVFLITLLNAKLHLGSRLKYPADIIMSGREGPLDGMHRFTRRCCACYECILLGSGKLFCKGLQKLQGILAQVRGTTS